MRVAVRETERQYSKDVKGGVGRSEYVEGRFNNKVE